MRQETRLRKENLHGPIEEAVKHVLTRRRYLAELLERKAVRPDALGEQASLPVSRLPREARTQLPSTGITTFTDPSQADAFSITLNVIHHCIALPRDN